MFIEAGINLDNLNNKGDTSIMMAGKKSLFTC